ncbi:MAG: FAD-dependent oxidoreductase [Thalassotalea sp.]
MIKTIAVVGAGLIGRLVALSLTRQGYQITMFDKDNKNAKNSAAYAAAGLLTPLGEAPQCEKNIVAMGFASLKLWPEILSGLEKPVFFQQQGSLLVSHEQDHGDYQRFDRFIKNYYPEHQIDNLNRAQLLALEPDLSRSFHHGISLPEEGQIDNLALLNALAHDIEKTQITWCDNTCVEKMQQEQVHGHSVYYRQHSEDKTGELHKLNVDLVIDCRGIGAKKTAATSSNSSADTNTDNQNHQLSELRAVRGEVFKLYAPDVNITRPIRLMHPRYQLYIAPKGNGHVSVGATQIESEDSSPMTVRSAMELLSATYSVCSGFAEANIIEQISQLRPAFHDNQPKIFANHHLIQVNGLFRHGYLISPVVLQQVLDLVNLIQSNKALNSPCRYSDLLPISLLDEPTFDNKLAS